MVLRLSPRVPEHPRTLSGTSRRVAVAREPPAPSSLVPSTLAPARAAPDEIGFLVHYGVSSARIAMAAEKSSLQGIPADEVLLAEGHVSADFFYRALARHLRLPFLDEGGIALQPGAAYPDMIAAGLAPLEPKDGTPQFLLAPQGRAIRQLMAARRRGHADNITLTTPRRLSRLVLASAGTEIAHAASLGLAQADPGLCAKGGISGSQTALLTTIVCLLAFFAPLAPFRVAMICAACLCLAFLAIFWLRLSACGASLRAATPPVPSLTDAELPIYSIVIALYREAAVVPQLLSAVTKLDYPDLCSKLT